IAVCTDHVTMRRSEYEIIRRLRRTVRQVLVEQSAPLVPLRRPRPDLALLLAAFGAVPVGHFRGVERVWDGVPGWVPWLFPGFPLPGWLLPCLRPELGRR